MLVTITAGSSGAFAIACGVFGSDAEPDAPVVVPAEGSVDDGPAKADGPRVDGDVRPSCPETCEAPCVVDGVCGSFDIGKGLNGSMGVPFALAIDDATKTLYIGDRQQNGGILTCPILDGKGQTCSAKMIHKQAGLTAMYVGDRVYWASADPPATIGSIAIGGGSPVVFAGNIPPATSVVGASQEVIALAATGQPYYCTTGITGVDCLPNTDYDTVTSLAGHTGTYCMTGRVRGSLDVSVFCGATVGGGVPTPVANEGDGGVLGRAFVGPLRVFWANGPDIRSADRPPAAAGAIVTLPGPGVGPFVADGNTVFYVAGDAIFTAPRAGPISAARKIATSKVAMTALAVSPSHVYFAYGEGVTSGISRVPR